VLNDTIGVEVLQVDSSVTAGATVSGNNLANTLIGAAGNDVLIGNDGNDQLEGGGGTDTLDGGAGNDQLEGGAGDDALNGGAGNDMLDGGAGVDTLIGGTGDDIYIIRSAGTVVQTDADGTDTAYLFRSNYKDDKALGAAIKDLQENKGIEKIFVDPIMGGKGDDNLEGGIDDDVVIGGGGKDTVKGGGGNDTIISAEGDDSIEGGDGDDSLDGGKGNDWLDGGKGNDTVKGGEGDDTVIGAADNDSLEGGEGNDTLDGGTGNDTLDGGTGNDTLKGAVGDDSLEGGEGNDSLDGGLGNDTLKGSDGDDTLLGGEGDDSLVGGAGNDTLNGGPGQDTLAGGGGNDTYLIHDVNDVIVEDPDPLVGGIDTALVFAPGYTLGSNVGVEVLQAAVDTGVALTGNALANTIIGGKGNDTLDGGKGAANTFQGGEGNDVYYLRNKDDLVLKDDDGIDTAHIYKDNYSPDELAQLLLDLAEAGIDNVIQEEGTGAPANTGPTGLELSDNWVREGSAVGAYIATLTGLDEDAGESLTYKIVQEDGTLVDNDGRFMIVVLPSGEVELQLAGPMQIDYEKAKEHEIKIRVTDKAGEFYETQPGDVAIQVLNRYRETVTGTGANETILSGIGNDTLDGGAGNDVLNAGAGLDRLTGGLGNDVFQLTTAASTTNTDTIVDFTVGQDRIEVKGTLFGLGATPKPLPGGQFGLGSTATTLQQRLLYDASSGTLYYDKDGMNPANAPVKIAVFSNKPMLSASDFFII
jgi:Ca2+-binding RTX toxin-like protein